MAKEAFLIAWVAALMTLPGCPGAEAPQGIPNWEEQAEDGGSGSTEVPGSPEGSASTAEDPSDGCDPWLAVRAQCSYQLSIGDGGCPRLNCMDAPCRTDSDCPALPADGAAERCVLGSCVRCWDDGECDEGRVCRAGRCTSRGDPACPAVPSCDEAGCNLVSISEVPCPVCLCEGPCHRPCAEDDECLPVSSYTYSRCVYGRCTECRNDDDCGGTPCLPPGVCKDTSTHPSAIYGTWLIGWPGGTNHYSLIRFEPDGTLRRGRLPEAPGWLDDIPPFPCDPGAADQWPVLGTWEPVEEGALRVRLVSGVPCDGEAWSQEYRVHALEDGESLSFLSAEVGGPTLDAMRMPVDTCDAAFLDCALPEAW